jgi:transposase
VEVAKKFNLSKTTVFEWSKKLSPQKNRTKKPTKIDDAIAKAP